MQFIADLHIHSHFSRATSGDLIPEQLAFWAQKKGIENFFYTGNKKGIKPGHAGRLEIILDRLNAANEIKDMNYPGSNLHKLTGDKKGQYAVKVSGNWRIFFEFFNGDAYVVDYDDYH